jgi:hypothetical protein
MKDWYRGESRLRKLFLYPAAWLLILSVILVLSVVSIQYYNYTQTSSELEQPEEIPVTEHPSVVVEDHEDSRADEMTPISAPERQVAPEAEQETVTVSDTVYIETRYPVKHATATVFWAGEAASPDNSYIHNKASAFDPHWEVTYGGYDDPNDRCGYYPCAFTPNQNPLYVALPYSDLTDEGMQKEDASEDVPWFRDNIEPWISQVQGRMVAVEYKGTVCYGWWADVGPYETHDVGYVFGSADTPLTTIGMSAGIDVSPGLRDCLGMGGVGQVTWRHVDAEDVPAGPWSL